MQVINQPWPHLIIDGLIDHDWLKLLTSYSRSAESNRKFGLHHFKHRMFDQHINEGWLEYQSRVQDLLPQLNSIFVKRRRSEDLDYVSHLAIQPANYIYPPHCDHPDKIYSVVTYICPDSSIGTDLYATNEGDQHTRIEWLPGRTLIFAGLDDITWHSYHSGDRCRTTLCGFFVRSGSDPTI